MSGTTKDAGMGMGTTKHMVMGMGTTKHMVMGMGTTKHMVMGMGTTKHTKYTKRELPEGWRWVRLGELGTLEAGGTPAKERQEYWNGGIAFVTGADITALNITRLNARAFLSKEGLYSGKTAICEPNTILIVTRTRVGRAGIAQETMGVSQDITAFKCGRDILPEFLCRYLHNISEYLRDNCRGATIQGLTRGFVDSLGIPLPPLSEQRRIAAILAEQMGAVDAARVAAEARLDAINALPAAFLRQVFPQPGASLPEGWRWVKLGEVIEIVSGQVDPKEPRYRDLPHVNGENIQSGTGRLMEVRSAAEDQMTSGKYLFEAGVVLYSKLRPYLKKAVMADFRGLCSADMYPISPDLDILTVPFLLQILLSEPFTVYAVSESQRARMPKLNRDQLFAYSAPIPPLSEQERITADLADKMVATDAARAAAQAELETINALPAALLRRAFNGEI